MPSRQHLESRHVSVTWRDQVCCASSVTPAPGTFVLSVVPPGTIRLLIQTEGYQPIERDVTFTFDGGPASIDFQLQPDK